MSFSGFRCRILLPRVIESTFRSVWGKTVDHLHEAFSDALRVQDDQQADLDSVGTTVLFFEALLTSFGDIFRRDALRNPVRASHASEVMF